MTDPRKPARLSQDPHALRESREKNLEVAIGRQVRELRKRQRMTGGDLAAQTGLSVGMLSKIENGVISPSLTTLQMLAHALRVPLVQLFSGYEELRGAMHVKAGEGVEIERAGTRAGHQYHLLGHIGSNNSGVVVEPYLIVLTTESDRFPTFQHAGSRCSICWKAGSITGTAIRSICWNRAIRCCLIRTRPMAPKPCMNCRRATFR